MPAAHPALTVGRTVPTTVGFAVAVAGVEWWVNAGTPLELRARRKDEYRVRVRWPMGDREWWMSAAELQRVTSTEER